MELNLDSMGTIAESLKDEFGQLKSVLSKISHYHSVEMTWGDILSDFSNDFSIAGKLQGPWSYFLF